MRILDTGHWTRWTREPTTFAATKLYVFVPFAGKINIVVGWYLRCVWVESGVCQCVQCMVIMSLKWRLIWLKGTETPYRPHDQFQMSRRGNTMVAKQPRFKVWISLLKFKIAPKFGVSEEALIGKIPTEDCNGMLRLWDGPLREPPICKDLNW